MTNISELYEALQAEHTQLKNLTKQYIESIVMYMEKGGTKNAEKSLDLENDLIKLLNKD